MNCPDENKDLPEEQQDLIQEETTAENGYVEEQAPADEMPAEAEDAEISTEKTESLAELPEEEPEAEREEEVEEFPDSSDKKHRGRRFWKAAAKALALMIVIFGIAGISSWMTAELINRQWQAEMSDHALTPAQVYRSNMRAVVAVYAEFGTSTFEKLPSSGYALSSGFLISADGYVVTNLHAVEDATVISVITYNGQEYAARLVGYDSTHDVAVLKAEGENLSYVKIGSSDALAVGDQVVTIGTPLGSTASVLTVGYISAKNKTVSATGIAMDMLQTDAAMNSGNSGGPLFNMFGEVVGINSAKYSGYSQSGVAIEGVAFAIPIDVVIDVIRDLQEYGYITGAYLGVTVFDSFSTESLISGQPVGAEVSEVVAGAAADRAGILSGDIIIGIGEYEVSGISELSRVLRKFDAEDTTVITVYRDGEKVSLSITLDERPPEISKG